MVLTVVGALLGGLGSALRTDVVGEGWGTGTYVVDALAVLLVVIGVGVEGRALDILASFYPDVRRQSVLQLVVGLAVAIVACLWIPAVRADDLPGWASTLLAAVVYLGGARGLSGAVGVAITVAPGYLERRIDDRLEEPW